VLPTLAEGRLSGRKKKPPRHRVFLKVENQAFEEFPILLVGYLYRIGIIFIIFIVL